MLTKSVKSVISVVLKHIAQAKKSVQSVRSVSFNIRIVSPDSNNLYKHCLIFPRDASPPLEVAFGPQDRSHAYVLPDSNTGEYTMLRSIGGLYVLHKKDSKFV